MLLYNSFRFSGKNSWKYVQGRVTVNKNITWISTRQVVTSKPDDFFLSLNKLMSTEDYTWKPMNRLPSGISSNHWFSFHVLFFCWKRNPKEQLIYNNLRSQKADNHPFGEKSKQIIDKYLINIPSVHVLPSSSAKKRCYACFISKKLFFFSLAQIQNFHLEIRFYLL